MRTLVDITRLAERFNMHSQSESGKLDIERHEPGILSLFHSFNSDYDVIFDFCVE